MVISSYPVEEAKEYIPNLDCLRFKKLVVHGYPGLLQEVKRKDNIKYAGSFFYANRHDFPDREISRKNIRFSQKIFCIPAIEPYYNNTVQKPKVAVSWMNHEKLQKVKEMDDDVDEIIQRILRQTTTVKGGRYLPFLENRLRVSYIYLDAFEKGAEIQTIKKNGKSKISDAEQKGAIALFKQALLAFDKSMNLHSQMLPDKESEGTLINFRYAPVYGLKVLRNKHGNVQLDAAPLIENSKDAPLLPIYI